MASQWASRLGALRHLTVTNGLSRPTRVIELQNQLRQLSLASGPRVTAPLACPLSSLNSQQSHSFATASSSAKPKRATKAKTATNSQRKSSTSTKKAKKPLTEAQKEQKAKRAEINRRKELQEKALKEPKKLPQTVRGLALKDAFAEHRGQHEGTIAIFKAAVESLNQRGQDSLKEVDKNRAANEAAYESWVKSYTPLQIKEANLARRALARENAGKKKLPVIKDDRQVKRPTVAFIQFTKERATGTDFKDMGAFQTEAGKEWQQMTDAQKEPYVKRAEEDRERYFREYLQVYGVEAEARRSA